MSPMTKKDLIKRISQDTGLRRSQVSAVADGIFDGIREAVSSGESVYIQGLGTFERRTRAAKTGRDIRRGKPIALPSQDVPAFRPTRGFRESVLPSPPER